ncbi:phosphoethanolamine--lipid A transferase [Psychrobium sp. MM17-31]|uniref:phosphoethanolamine transferase n=1 Tax=Psychrobium sp. MM17-31 TaxID=2917758 RepID=UPI001EF63490|nr:phosphoethanolamine--lipid A transferase [Psychrobium sp. MM17-31]MCG7530943.1 phosphoethanolamine--lipid A transferase [Psychrobium sp. MM17-31]
MLQRLQPKLTSSQLLLVITLYFTLVFNYPFLQGFMGAILALEQFNIAFLLSVPLVIGCILLIVFSILALPKLLKPTLIAITLTSALVFYASLNYGTVFDYGMIQNSVETDQGEALSYVNLQALITFVLVGVLPALFIATTQLTPLSIGQAVISRLRLIAAAFAVLLTLVFFFYQDYAAVGRNNSHLKKIINPTQYIYSGVKYVKHNYFDNEIPFKTLDSSPTLNTPKEKEVMVIVLGETARAKNFASNGYDRDTNLYTAPYAMTSFEKMYSCGTATAVSVPCMFSSMTRDNFERRQADKQQNVIDIAQLAGFDVQWISNNGCKNVCDRVPTINIDLNQPSPLCDGHYCQDEILLTPLAKKLANLQQEKTLIVLHMMGSHGPTYYKRYPNSHQKFTPDCRRSDIQNCSQEQLINTYDNTIAYTDFVISKVVAQLDYLAPQYKASMLYISDHGESLGESGVYLHGLPYSFSPVEQRHIPMLLWSSNQRHSSACIAQRAKEQRFSHDNLFHSLLGWLSISSSAYQNELDIFAHCEPSPNIANNSLTH